MATEKPSTDTATARARIQDVAALAGVSTATVSRVLNGHPDVSQSTRDEVMRYIRELGYSSNRRPSTRTDRRVRLIALSVPGFRGDYVTEIVTGAMEALHHRDARLVLCSSNGDPLTGEPLSERLLAGMTDGALLVLSTEPNGDLASYIESGYPLVAIEPIMPVDERVPVVATANWGGAKLAADHLINLGHTHIGTVTGPIERRVSAERLAGYQAALLAAGLPLVPKLVQAADWTIEGGYTAGLQLLALPHRPTAIFAMNDAMAVGVLRAARETGLHVPRDLSLVGFDDVGLASITVPALTTVRQPLQGLGRVGVDILYRLIQGQPLDASRVELSATLVVRESTAPPHGTSFLT